MPVFGFVPPRAMPAGKKKPALVRSPFNNIRPYKPIRPGEPVPEPLPPAPLLGPKELLGLGLLVLTQIWGRFNSRPGTAPTNTPPPGTTQEEIDQPTATAAYDVVVWYDLKGKTFGGSCNTGTRDGRILSGSQRFSYAISNASQLFWQIQPASADCDGSHAGRPNQYLLMRGTGNVLWFSNASDGYSSDYWVGDVPLYAVVEPGAVPQFPAPLPPGYEPEPLALPETEPRTVPKYPPTPTPLRPATPAPTPSEPDVEPALVPITPGPSAPPNTQPLVPRRTVPLPLPGATPTKDGAIVPRGPSPIAVTPKDAHYPIPGGAPVLGNGPQPKPEAIAQELGRIEQKLNILSNPNTDGMGDGSDRMALITNILGRLLEFMTSITAGGGYSLSSPCEVDEAGNPVVSVVEYGGATDALGVLSNKIDALAAVMQVHKDLKQPICKQTPAVGENVTVNFVQVD